MSRRSSLRRLISTFANDGVYVAPRIVAGTVPPQAGRQTVAFHPAEARRVVSSFTAAEMRSMMQKVVLEGTGRKATLDGYTSARKDRHGPKGRSGDRSVLQDQIYCHLCRIRSR